MRRFARLLFVIIIIACLVVSIGIMCGAAVLYKYSDSQVSEELMEAVRSYDETRFYYFDWEDRLYETGMVKEIEDASLGSGIKYEYVDYSKMPENLISAFVAIEDKRFYTHDGIDYKRSIGAVINYVVGGKKTFGGSSITQQLVKNITGNDALLVERKLTEAFSAMSLEKSYEKSEILEMYLNIINLSRGCRGVGAAARYYFSKNVSDLDLCECACLAAITNNPAKYDPISHPSENKKRRDIVLSCMLDEGYISRREYERAIRSDTNLNIADQTSGKYNSWYVDSVIKDVICDFSQKYDIAPETASVLLYKGGYKIYTAMDIEIQNILDEYFSNLNNFPCDENGETPQASMIVIDPYSGDALGIVGGVGEKRGDRIQSYATDTKRPPGSAIKPLSVYAPAIDRGLVNWATVIEDSPVRLDKKTNTGWPSNANKLYIGNVNVRYALANSLNTVAVKILKMLGNEESYDFLTDDLLISSLDRTNDIGDASLALGQPSKGITLRELTSAYTIFENGMMSKSRTYYKVTDKNGKVILDNSYLGQQAISQSSANVMTRLLQEVVENGTASGYITLADRVEVAGKTGTSQYSQDKYFIGYTPELLAGVWQGYEMPKTINCYKGNYSICIWDDVMSKIYNDTKYFKALKFKMSNRVVRLSYNKNTGKPPSEFDCGEALELGWFDIGNKD